MILNVLCHLLNRSASQKYPIWIAVAGNDLIYKRDGKDHFYGHGQADPLRIGQGHLVEQLCLIKVRAEELKCTICNVSGQEETLLPFVRYSL